MTDGTYGARYSIEQIDGAQDSGSQLAIFLSVVNADVSSGVEGTFGSTRPATCFPNGSSFACSWDVELAHEIGEALAAECQAFGVNILLGPGINIRRTPLAGRSYEYYSEDPVLTGEIAAAVINGRQENGVGASLKHFACNNSEVQRTTMSSVVEERALHEIYLAGFKRAISKSNPWTVMSAYNRLNDVQAAENRWLLTEILRDGWGYDGVVVSDWHGIKDRPASMKQVTISTCLKAVPASRSCSKLSKPGACRCRRSTAPAYASSSSCAWPVTASSQTRSPTIKSIMRYAGSAWQQNPLCC